MGLETYEDALRYLFTSTDYEKMQRVRYNADTFSLDRMGRLLEALGSPESRFESIHIAGTKGKGSTAAILHALALECGLKAGLYISPHLVDIRERIRVGWQDISREDLRRLIEAARPHIDRMRAEGDAPTFFEIFTALAFRRFADVRVDLAIVETGLGGRLDATNVLKPQVSVITAISLDHTHQLGDSLAAIAAEKAGIVKRGVTVVCQPQPAEAVAVIEDTCRRVEAPLVRVGLDVTYAWATAERAGGRLSVRTPHAAYEDLFLPLMGEHQAVNAATAIAAAELAGPLGERLSPERVRSALVQVRWPGRMEYVPGRPDLLLDGAHNRASMERLFEAVSRHFAGRRIVVVFGSAADKDVDGMLAVLAGLNVPLVFTRTDNPRAASPADLRERFERLGGEEAEAIPDARAALRTAGEKAGPDGLVLVCGSLYLVGEVKGLLASADSAGAERRSPRKRGG